MTTPEKVQAPGPRRRGPNASTPARRAQLVRAALESFAQHGYERASLRDIAARAGVTHAALLRHFSGKDELLLAALAQGEEDEEKQAARLLDAGTAGAQVLGEVLREQFADPDYQRNWLALSVAATDPAHPAHEYFMGRRERLRTRLKSDPLPTSRDSPHLSADEKVTLVLAVVDGLRIQSLLDPACRTLDLLEVFMKLVVGPDQPPTASGPARRG